VNNALTAKKAFLPRIGTKLFSAPEKAVNHGRKSGLANSGPPIAASYSLISFIRKSYARGTRALVKPPGKFPNLR
jgi:hypothetical protein